MFGAFARFSGRIDAEDPHGSYLLTCLLLASAGGFADAASYVLTGSFTGHLTGNALLAAIGIVEHDGGQALACSAAVASFVLGTAAGAAWPHRDVGGRLGTLLAPLVAEIAVIGLGVAASAAVGHGGGLIVLVCVCLALGLQNGTLDRFGSVSVHSTYITGMSTSLITALVTRTPDPKSSVLPLIISAFVGGAFFGAFFAHRDGAAGFAVLLAPLTPAAVLAGLARRAAGLDGEA